MRMLDFIIALGLLGLLCGCNEEFAADPPPRTPESVASDSPTSVDAGSPPREASHAMTVTTAAEGDADARYRVVFGSGHGATRSRGQATADLYQELRDRTALGARLEAEAHTVGDGGARARKSSPEASSSSSDPLSAAAVRLLDLVDEVGEITIDVVTDTASSRCLVSMRGSASECLVQAPEHTQQQRMGGGGGRRGH
jgi:hypothetical protein